MRKSWWQVFFFWQEQGTVNYIVEILLAMCERDVVDNHKFCSEFFWIINKYATMVSCAYSDDELSWADCCYLAMGHFCFKLSLLIAALHHSLWRRDDSRNLSHAIFLAFHCLPWVPEVSRSRRAGAEITDCPQPPAARNFGPSSPRTRNLWNPG